MNNTKVYLTKALKVDEEAALEALRQKWVQVYKEYFQKAGNRKSPTSPQSKKMG